MLHQIHHLYKGRTINNSINEFTIRISTPFTTIYDTDKITWVENSQTQCSDLKQMHTCYRQLLQVGYSKIPVGWYGNWPTVDKSYWALMLDSSVSYMQLAAKEVISKIIDKTPALKCYSDDGLATPLSYACCSCFTTFSDQSIRPGYVDCLFLIHKNWIPVHVGGRSFLLLITPTTSKSIIAVGHLILCFTSFNWHYTKSTGYILMAPMG